MRILELFSGTGSIGRAFQARGWEVISLDILSGATITQDILTWDYTVFPHGHFDFIWASPPCTEYSKARTRTKRPRNWALADAVVCRTLDIIDDFRPELRLIENPQTGYLKNRPFMPNILWQDVTYCRYGAPYKKQTRLWGTFPFQLRPICRKHDFCGNVVDGRHPFRAQREHRGVRRSLEELYAIPRELCDEIASLATIWT